MERRENLGKRVAELARQYPKANRCVLMQQMYALQEHYREQHGMYKDQEGLYAQEDFAYDVIKRNLENNLYTGKQYKPPETRQ